MDLVEKTAQRTADTKRTVAETTEIFLTGMFSMVLEPCKSAYSGKKGAITALRLSSASGLETRRTGPMCA